MPYLKKAPKDRKDWQVYVLVIKFFSLGTQLPFVFELYITPMQFAGHWPLPYPQGEGNGTPLQYSCLEGNGNPLQCSCLENPRDIRAWWTAVYGVTQSRT